MAVILNLAWAIVLLPVVGVGLAFLAETPRRAAQVGIALTALAFAVSLVVLVFRLTHVIPAYENTQTFWSLQTTTGSGADARFPGDFLVLWGIRVDPLSVAFMASTLLLSLLAQLHGLASLRGDRNVRRFSWATCVLTFGVLAAIASPNLFQLWLGWEVSGVAAWILAAHHWQRPGMTTLWTRTFAVLRVADLALLLALVMTFAKFGGSVSRVPPPSGSLTADPFSFSVLAAQWHGGHIGLVAGVGARTLVVLSVLFVVAALVRAAVGPLHVWFSGVLEAPTAAVAMVATAALVPAVVLLARVYPLLVEAPGVLDALALVGSLGATGAAVLALAQRDLFRIGMFAVGSQAALILATLGMGGYSPALFALFTGTCLAVTYFLAAGSLARAYRSRDLADCGGARQRLPRTTLALAGWAAGISGLSLNTYSFLSVALRNTRPVGGGVAGITQVVVVLAVLVTMVLTALYSFRVVVVAAGGVPSRRRGFDTSRVREAEPATRRPMLLALAAAAVATVVGIPGISSFTIGSRQVPALTFSHFIFYGPIRQQLAVDGAALLVAVAVLVGGALAARWLFAPAADVHPLRTRAAPAGAFLAGPTPGERAAALLPVGLMRVGQVLDEVDAQLLAPIPDAMGESVGVAATLLARLRTPRIALSTAAAVAVIALIVAASVLAVTGHFPVSTQ
jgi:NADH:ubiquinone oxidoreductase subunit 5 (subunit L)/multisubunit Na+/H+ antiporter MnhA subunit